MLARVPAEDDPASVVTDVPEQLLHLLGADLAGFVNDDDRPRRQLLFRQKFADGLNVLESIALQADDLLSLRRDDLNGMTGGLQPTAHLSQSVTFARAGPAAKQRDEIARIQDVINRRTLVAV